jgi:hypothetical protein
MLWVGKHKGVQMSGHEPRQDPEERYAPWQGSANAMPRGTQPESGDKGKSGRESRFASFREWINTSVGVTTVIIAVLAFIGGGTAITVKLASPDPVPTPTYQCAILRPWP